MSSKEIEILKLKDEKTTTHHDTVVLEEPLQISLSGSCIKTPTGTKNIAVTMRTPGDDENLAAGFLYGEGIIASSDQVLAIDSKANKIDLKLDTLEIPLSKLDRNFYTTSSCGVCGKSSIEAISFNREVPTVTERLTIKAELVYLLPSKARDGQKLFHKTGGIHAATLFDYQGNIVAQYEDVGRHNAMDKVVGSGFLQNLLPYDKHVLLLSGRASFELIQKAVMAGIQIVVAIGAPSSLAVELAEEYDVTLIGFLRDASFNIYTSDYRIIR